MKRSKKKYKRPMILWDKARIERDKELKDEFGLVRKKEIWNAETFLRKYRRLARRLVSVNDKEQEKILINKLIRLGILEKGDGLDDVLGLVEEDILRRRLQTIVHKNGFANTPSQARQLIVHGHIKIGNRRAKSPSRIVLKSEEDIIELSEKMKKALLS